MEFFDIFLNIESDYHLKLPAKVVSSLEQHIVIDHLAAEESPVYTYYPGLNINSAPFHSQTDPSLDDKLHGHLIYGEFSPDLLCSDRV